MVTSKGIPIPFTNLQLNPYLNTQLDLLCRDNLSFQCTAPSTWLTNRYTDPSTWLTTNLRRMLTVKFFNSSTWWRSRNFLVTKPYSVQTQQLLQEKDELGHMSPVHNMLVKNFCIEARQLWRPLKQSLYMFRVMRKESPNMYTLIGVKSNLKNLIFLNLDRYPIYWETVEHRA